MKKSAQLILQLLIFLFSIKAYCQEPENTSKISLGLKAGPVFSKFHNSDIHVFENPANKQVVLDNMDLQLKTNISWNISVYSDILLYKNFWYSPEINYYEWKENVDFRLIDTRHIEIYNSKGLLFLPFSVKYISNRNKKVDYSFHAGLGTITVFSSSTIKTWAYENDILLYNNNLTHYPFSNLLLISRIFLRLSPGIIYQINKRTAITTSLDYNLTSLDYKQSSMIYNILSSREYMTIDYTSSMLAINIGLKYNFPLEKKSNKKKKRRKR